MSAKNRFIQWYARRTPPRWLRLLSIPLDHQLKTTDWPRFERARMLETAFGFVANNEVRGDYLEFGVFEGNTFLHAWRTAQRYQLPSRFHAFDSFQGLPEPALIDAGGQFHAGQYSASQALFQSTLRRGRVDMSRLTITPGFFADTLTTERQSMIDLRAAAVIWIDCDLYESTVPVLEFLSDVIVDGAVLCFDDWYCYKGRPDRGERLACAEWLGRHPELRVTPYHAFHWAGQSFIVHRD